MSVGKSSYAFTELVFKIHFAVYLWFFDAENDDAIEMSRMI